MKRSTRGHESVFYRWHIVRFGKLKLRIELAWAWAGAVKSQDSVLSARLSSASVWTRNWFSCLAVHEPARAKLSCSKLFIVSQVFCAPCSPSIHSLTERLFFGLLCLRLGSYAIRLNQFNKVLRATAVNQSEKGACTRLSSKSKRVPDESRTFGWHAISVCFRSRSSRSYLSKLKAPIRAMGTARDGSVNKLSFSWPKDDWNRRTRQETDSSECRALCRFGVIEAPITWPTGQLDARWHKLCKFHGMNGSEYTRKRQFIIASQALFVRDWKLRSQ